MLVESEMILICLCAGAAVGSMMSYRLLKVLFGQEKEKKLRASIVENQALNRTNSIYRERIEQLEKALFSNEKYLEMAREIERLSADNFKLRSKLRDITCLMEAEKKKSNWERVERLEKIILELRSQLEAEHNRPEIARPVEILSGSEIAVAMDFPLNDNEPRQVGEKKWTTIQHARRI